MVSKALDKSSSTLMVLFFCQVSVRFVVQIMQPNEQSSGPFETHNDCCINCYTIQYILPV